MCFAVNPRHSREKIESLHWSREYAAHPKAPFGFEEPGVKADEHFKIAQLCLRQWYVLRDFALENIMVMFCIIQATERRRGMAGTNAVTFPMRHITLKVVLPRGNSLLADNIGMPGIISK